MTLEADYGVPTVALHTHPFEGATRSAAKANGMPSLQQVYVPHPVMGKSRDELRAYVQGADPTTGRPVMQEIVAALTGGDDEPAGAALADDRTPPRFVAPDTEERLHERFMRWGWTDYLPIVLPTEERVEQMLRCTRRDPDEIVGQMRPTEFREAWDYTVEKVAVNAVMAGCRPEYLPVVLALAATQLSARPSTTSSAASMAVVNGPIRAELGVNCGVGAMGPYAQANATIGRAWGLLSQNLQGGSVPGQTYLGSQGNNYAYNSMLFGENEESSPWEAFHVQHGYGATESVVSTFGMVRSTAFSLGLRERQWQHHVRNLLRGLDPLTSPVLLLDPQVARQFVERGGFDTKEGLIAWVYEHATLPAAEYWDYQTVQNYVYPQATAGVQPYAERLQADPDELLPMFEPREEVHVVVVGGETNGYWRIMGAGGAHRSAPIDDWR